MADGENVPTICVDLDGVLNLYDGWKGETIFADPRPGAKEFLCDLDMQGYRIVVFTSRNINMAHDWLAANGFIFASVSNEKIPALVYLDDRGMHFNGKFDGVLEKIQSFKAHWEKEEVVA